jgi:hypothetical protein
MTLTGSRPKRLAGGRPLERRVRRHQDLILLLGFARQDARFVAVRFVPPPLHGRREGSYAFRRRTQLTDYLCGLYRPRCAGGTGTPYVRPRAERWENFGDRIAERVFGAVSALQPSQSVTRVRNRRRAEDAGRALVEAVRSRSVYSAPVARSADFQNDGARFACRDHPEVPPNVRAERAAAGGAAWPWKGQFNCWPWKGQVALPVEVRSSEGLGVTAPVAT